MKTLLSLATLAFVTFFALPAAQADDMGMMQDTMTAKPSVVLFYADSCGQCKILEPKLESALHELGEDSVHMVKFDYSTRETIMASKDVAAENGLDAIQKKYGAKTGFAVIANDKGEETAMIKASDSEEEILETLKTATKMSM
jgi:thiol-disulfide isomerase/thioredoxin